MLNEHVETTAKSVLSEVRFSQQKRLMSNMTARQLV